MDDWAAFTEAAGRPEPSVIRTRTGRISPEALVERLAAQGFRVVPKPGLEGFFEVADGPTAISATVEHWLGLFYVQQASTGVAAPLLDPKPGERVLDLCSAPGGKTTHAADLMGDTGCLVAGEISESRIRGLLGNVYRLGHPNIFVVSGDGRDFPEEASFDRVLVDAPCSGEGTLRRSGGKAPFQSKSFKGYVTGAQRGLLEKAIRVTRPGGTILYVTCTFAPEENEAVVDHALRTQPVELEPIEPPVPHARGLTSFGDTRYDSRLEGAVRIYPHHLDSEGLFIAKLTKLDDGSVADEGWWSAPPTFFATPGEQADDAVAADLVRAATDELTGRFGVPPEVFDDSSFILRGGRLWLHTLQEWPFPAWKEGPWRPISVGFRAVDFDSRGRARPTNDLLRWLGDALSNRVQTVTSEELQSLVAREPVGLSEDILGPVAIRHEGAVIGRGAATQDGLKSEIPKARAADLMRAFKQK